MGARMRADFFYKLHLRKSANQRHRFLFLVITHKLYDREQRILKRIAANSAD